MRRILVGPFLCPLRITPRQLVTDLRALEPPQSAAEIHEVALGVVSRLAATEAAMVVHAKDETITHIGEVWDTAEGQSARAAEEEAIEVCKAAQAFFDGTAARHVLAGVPWITSDLTEVVELAFDCSAADRSLH